MSGRGSRVKRARWWCAAAVSALLPSPLFAQAAPAPPPAAQPDAAELDPNAPLAPMPDLGVAWPTLHLKATAPPPPTTAAPTQKNRSRVAAEMSGAMRHTLQVERLGTIG